MLNSIDSLFAPVGTALYSVIVTILVWPNASKTLWVNKSNLLLSKTPRNWHTPLMLAIGNVSAKSLAPTNQPPSPPILPTTSPTGSPTATLNPPAATTIPTSPLPEPIPIPTPIPTTTSPANLPRVLPTNPPPPTSERTAN